MCELLDRQIHLLIIDPFPPGPRDPQGVHAAIWEQFEGAEFYATPEQPLTCVAYECDSITRAYIEPYSIGQMLPTTASLCNSSCHEYLLFNPRFLFNHRFTIAQRQLAWLYARQLTDAICQLQRMRAYPDLRVP